MSVMSPPQKSAISFHALGPEWEQPVAELNERLRGVPDDIPHNFPTRPSARWSRAAGRASGIHQEYYVAADGDAVRGGYVLKLQQFDVGGRRETIGNLQLPLSEGLVDRKYALVGIQVLHDVLRRSEKTYALGMGGMDKSLPRLLKGLGWWLHPVPMRVRILRPSRVLRIAPYIRKTPQRRLGCDLLAWSGAGWLGIQGYQRWRTTARRQQAHVEAVPELGAWTHDVWEAGAELRAFGAVRGGEALGHLYPASDPRFTRLRIDMAGRPAGWAVLTNRVQPGHRHFGPLQLGALVDCAARPGAELAVVQAATDWLARNGADLVVTNQAHARWLQALDENGYLTAPSNFVFAASPALAREIGGSPDSAGRLHITRGDGDGPINL